MAKEVLIYGPIDYYSSTEFFKNVAEAEEKEPDADFVFRINTGGGEVDYGWGQIAKILELKSKRAKVDGKAHSMGLMTLCYIDDVEAVDVAQFILHRAAYPNWYELNPDYFDDVKREGLINMNKKLEAAFRAKIDVAAFEEMKGVKVKDVFSMTGRIEVNITAAEAKKIGLISRIVNITPKKKAEIEAQLVAVLAGHGTIPPVADETEVEEESVKNTDMTQEELKTKFPAVYAAIVAEGKAIGVTEGAKAEKERVAAWLPWESTDKVAVAKAIADGSVMTIADISALSEKKVSAQALKNLEDDSAKTPEVVAAEAKKKEEEEAKGGAKPEAEKKAESFLAEAKAERAAFAASGK